MINSAYFYLINDFTCKYMFVKSYLKNENTLASLNIEDLLITVYLSHLFYFREQLDNFFHKLTAMESPRKNNDCYFYYYSTCTKVKIFKSVFVKWRCSCLIIVGWQLHFSSRTLCFRLWNYVLLLATRKMLKSTLQFSSYGT